VSEKLVFDSFALVSLYHREPGWQVVQRALYDQEKARSRAILSWINWGEFYYIVKRSLIHLFKPNPNEFDKQNPRNSR
jgi:predicted nucleic acid-binding protein